LDISCRSLGKTQLSHVVISTQSKISRLEVVAFVTAMRAHVHSILEAAETILVFWHALVSITHAEFNVSDVVKDLSRKSGDKTPRRVHSNANLVIAMVIQTGAIIRKKLTCVESLWIFTVVMKVVAFVKIVCTTLKESIATNANRNFIDLMEGIGMRRMFVSPAIVTHISTLAIARKRLVDASVEWNLKNLTAIHARMDILVIPIAGHVNAF
jgi:hypothetical protein